MRSDCTSELHMSLAMVCMHLVLHGNCPILIKFGFFSTDFNKILQQQFSRKSVQWEPSSFIRTGGKTGRPGEAEWLCIVRRIFIHSVVCLTTGP
jgi:hypothetical protein